MSSQINHVLNEVERLKEEIVSITSELIRFQTISPPSNTRECAEYIKSYFEDMGLRASIHARKKEKANVYVRVPGKSNRTLIWLGHLDVVPAGSLDKWIHKPFSGTVVDGKVFGRGASDMKGSCAAAMVAAKILSGLKEQSHVTVDFWFTCDEEVGSPDGTRWLVSKGLIHGDLCLIGDSLSRSPEKEPYIDFGCKGYLRIKLKAHGKTAHGSMPFFGENAIDKLLLAVNQAKKIGNYALDLPPDMQNLANETIGYLLRREGLTDEQINAIKRAFNYPTISLTLINGGVKINVVPDYAEASLDIRLTPGTDANVIVKKIRELVRDLRIEGVEMEVINMEGGYYEQWDSGFALSLRKAMEIATGRKPKAKMLMGATDAIPIKRGLDVPCLGFGAGIEELAHAPNEYVTVNGLVAATKVYAILPLIL